MIVYDGLTIPGKPPSKELGLAEFENITDWRLYRHWREDTIDDPTAPDRYKPYANDTWRFDYTRLADDLLWVLADKTHPVCLDDEEMKAGRRGGLIDKEMVVERTRAFGVMKSHNPDCTVGFFGSNKEQLDGVPVDFYAPSQYLSKPPFTGLTRWIAPTDKPTWVYIRWQWESDGQFIGPATWRQVCEFVKENYEGCVLWSGGGDWDDPTLRELWTVAEEVFKLGQENMQTYSKQRTVAAAIAQRNVENANRIVAAKASMNYVIDNGQGSVALCAELDDGAEKTALLADAQQGITDAQTLKAVMEK